MTKKNNDTKKQGMSDAKIVEKAKEEAGAGHNSGKVNQPLIDIYDDYEKLEKDKQQIVKHQRDLRATAKQDHMVQSSVFMHEIRLRKMDDDVRVQFEEGHKDLKDMLGYQFALQLVEGNQGDDKVDPVEAAEKKAAAG